MSFDTKQVFRLALILVATASMAACATKPKPEPGTGPGTGSVGPGTSTGPGPGRVDSGVLPGSQQDFVINIGDFVYFDPPYVPVSSTANFTAYGSAGFGPLEQQRLVEELMRLKKAKVRAVLSNADTPGTRELYARFAVRVVHMRRSINRDTDKRGLSPELLVNNWEKPGLKEES